MKRTIRVLLVGAVVAGCLASAGPAFAAKTVCPSGCLTSSIQTAINAASPGVTITIGPGNYEGDLVVNKEVKLVGSGPTTVLYPSTSTPNCAGGSLCAGGTNMILVEGNNVGISSMRLEGANPSLAGKGVKVGGQEVNARNGIIENYNAGKFEGLTVSKVKVTDIYLRGIYASAEDKKFNFNHDTVENVQAEEASIAMFSYASSGVFESNKVSNANDAISSNWSFGVKYLKNTITKSGSGVHTDNNGGFGGGSVADTIEGNTVHECKSNGYGIFVFVPYLSATVNANKVTGCSVGLAVYGGAVSGEGPTFTANTVNGTGAPTTGATYGVYLTTDQLSYEYGNMTAMLSGNTISHFDIGMFVTQSNPTPGQPAGGQATVTATPNNSFLANGSGAVGEPGTKVNAKEDWWGCTAGPNHGHACQTVTGTVEYMPFLAAKP